ncbi:DUF2945 domain-containing protein [Mycobacterium intracellulare]|nr:DUF2945 domain-containing protein [Mycobacterium intracellulare]MDM3894642.1 DUF2945 domain-containing protein [Mycobacterium intracellulare]
MSNREFDKGDAVEWQSHGTTVRGTVEGEITSDTEAAGRTVRASADQPQMRCTSRTRCAARTDSCRGSSDDRGQGHHLGPLPRRGEHDRR